MHDYQLERLNTRSFEQLIQALGTAILGPQLMIFGDGPDGGREAIFVGAVNYPATSITWDGYGIVQAKFRQQPDSQAKKNADWAIQQLRSEFKKLKPRPKGETTIVTHDRFCPEYYIFATNISLSPVAKTGGKDRVRALLDGFKKSHGLKDYAIWDGDQIRRFLDVQPGIRTTYTAWLLPGDVLAEMMKVLELEKTDFLSTIRRYLESELLDDQFARLGQGGYTDAKNIPLCSVFVDLPVDISADTFALHNATLSLSRQTVANDEEIEDEKNQQETACTFLRLLFEEGRQVLKPSVVRKQAIHQNARKNQAGRIVLIGGPGQGKTTVGQFACQLYRVELLRATGGPFSPEVSQAIERIEQIPTDLPVVCARRYPLRVDLKHFAASLVATDDTRAKNLFDFLVNRISNRTNSTIKPDDFRRWLGGYPWVLVLDGLDEVPPSSNRQQVMQAIRDFLSVEAHSADADLLVLATTRPQGYSDEFDPSLYLHLPLAPLKADDALAYGSLLANARHPGQRTRVEELTTSLKRATSNPATVRLMQSPLQVTIMLALIEGGGEPPEQRWKLFHDYYDVIYRREKERGTSFSAILGSYEPDIHWIHHRAGWILQERNATLGNTDARFTHEEFEKLVDKRLQYSGHEDEGKRRDLVRTIRAAATDRLVFLVGNTEKEIGFEIRSLQEFMAAEHFFDGGESCVRKTLHSIAPYAYWRNVFLFAAGRIFFQRQELIDSIITICGELNDDPNDPTQQTIFAGSRLALTLLKDGAARNQPRSIRVIARCAARALDAHDDDSAVAFSEVFYGEAEEVWKDELTKRLISPGIIFPLQNWLLCLRLVGMGKSWTHELLLNNFPWISEHVHEVLGVYRYRKSCSETFWVEIAHRLLSYPPSLLVLLRMRDNFPEILKGEPLEQLSRLFYSHRGTRSDLPLLLESGYSSGIVLSVQGAECLKLWSEFQYPTVSETSHPEWRAFQAITTFARNPTKKNLATQLQVISTIQSDTFEQFMYWQFPWQITASLYAKNAGRSWSEIINLVNAGNLGNEDDWVRWEEQNKKGVKLSQLRFGGNWSISDELQGVVLETSLCGLGADSHQVLRIAEELSDALAKWPEIKNQLRIMTDTLCYLFFEHATTLTNNRQEIIARFVTICCEQEVVLTTDAIAAIIISNLSIDNKLVLLEIMGRCQIKSGWGADLEDNPAKVSELLKAIIEKLLTIQNWWNVLCALSFLPPLNIQEIPETLIQQLRFRGEDFSKVASVLRLSSLRWRENEAKDIVRESQELEKDFPNFLSELFDFIESSGKSGSHLEAFLVELLKQPLINLDSRMLNRATSLLVKLVERRPAIDTLPDPGMHS